MRASKPRKFKPVKGLKWVRIVDTPQFACTYKTPKGIKGKGIRYERRVVERLEADLPEHMVAIPGLWLQFEDANGVRYAQPDWFVIDTKELFICIAEVKLSRVPMAWWQLNRLYKPLLAEVFKGWEIATLEVTARLQNVVVPEDVMIVHSLAAVRPGKTRIMSMPYEPN